MPEKRLHPSDDQLNAFCLGQLPPDDAAEVESHISACDPCCETLLALSTDDTFIALLQDTKKPDDGLTLDQADSVVTNDRQPPAEVHAALAEHSRYKLVDLIAKGGMGDVFKAEHRMMERTVALKVIRPELMRKPEAVERFHREVKTAASVSHPNIVTSHDAEQVGDAHFLVMEFVDGVDLANLVKQRGALPVAEACEFIQQAANGLQYAHERGMVHRDIKPHNLMVTGDHTVKILDFGLASLIESLPSGDEEMPQESSLTLAGSIMGTPDYISPEQAEDAHQADIRSDIYSLGATLYYLLSGRAPFADGSVMQKLKSHAGVDPEPISAVRDDVPDEVAEVIRRMMAKDPAERFQTPAEIAQALAPFVDRYREKVPPTQPHTRTGHSRRPRRAAGALLFGALALLLSGIIYVETGKTTLRFEISDPSVRVTFENEIISVRTPENRQVFRVKPSTDQTFVVLHNGVEMESDSITLRWGQKITVKIDVVDGELQVTPSDHRIKASRTPLSPRPEIAGDNSVPEESSPIMRTAQLIGHRGQIPAMAFTTNSQRIVTGVGRPDYRVMQWDTSVGRQYAEFKGHRGTVRVLAASPDGRLIASGSSDKTIRLLDAVTLEEIARIDGHGSWVECLHFSPDSRRLASGSANWRGSSGEVSVRVWDVATRQEIWKNDLTYKDGEGSVGDVMFSPDGRRLVTAHFDLDKRISVWNSETGELLQRFGGKDSAVSCLRYSPDGRFIATGYRGRKLENNKWHDPEHCVIRLHDAMTGVEVRKFLGHQGPIASLDFTPDSRYLFSGGGAEYINNAGTETASSEYSVRVWEVETGQQTAVEKMTRPVKFLCISPDGTQLATSCGLNETRSVVQLWKINTDSLKQSNPEPSGDPPNVRRSATPVRTIAHEVMHSSLAYLPDGTIVTSAFDPANKGWKLYFTTPSSTQSENPVSAGDSGVSHLASTPDGKWLVAGIRLKNAVQLWDAERRQLVHTFDALGWVHGVTISSDGRLLAAASWDGSAKVWNRESRELVRELGDFGRVHRVQFSPDGTLLAVSASPSGKTELYDTATWKKHSEFKNDYAVGQMAFSSDGRLIATGGCGVRSKEAWKTWGRVWEVATGEMRMEFKEMQNAVSAVAISPDSRYLIAVGGDQGNQPNLPEPIRIWDLNAQRLVAEFDGHDRWVRDVAFLPDGKHFATVSNGVKVWNLESIVGNRNTNSARASAAIPIIETGDLLDSVIGITIRD